MLKEQGAVFYLLGYPRELSGVILCRGFVLSTPNLDFIYSIYNYLDFMLLIFLIVYSQWPVAS